MLRWRGKQHTRGAGHHGRADRGGGSGASGSGRDGASGWTPYWCPRDADFWIFGEREYGGGGVGGAKAGLVLVTMI